MIGIYFITAHKILPTKEFISSRRLDCDYYLNSLLDLDSL